MKKGSRVGSYMELLAANPAITNAEAAKALGITTRLASIYRCKLRRIGYIDYEDTNEPVKILITMPTDNQDNPDVDKQVLQEYRIDTIQQMVEKFLADFEAAERYRDRIEIGREIRLLLEML